MTLPTAGTLATLAGAEELTNTTLTSSVGKGTWTASGTWTLPALTLGGTVSGGGQQLNNIIIGTSTPLAGAFTTLSASGALTYGGVTLTAAVTGTGKMVLDTAPAFATSITAGVQQTTQGSLVLANTAAGAFATTLKSSNSASAAWTMTLPTTAGSSGYILTTNGSGVTSWVAPTGAVAGDMLAANNLSDVANKTTAFNNVSPVTTRGDIIVRDATNNVALALGTANKVLTSDGTDVTWNSVGAGRSSFLVNKGGTDQTGVADSTYTQVTFNTEVFDTGSNFASNAWTPPAGKVLIGAAYFAQGSISVGSFTALSIYKNGVNLAQFNNSSGFNIMFGQALLVDTANGTDAYTLYVYLDVASGTATISGISVNTYFYGSWLGPN